MSWRVGVLQQKHFRMLCRTPVTEEPETDTALEVSSRMNNLIASANFHIASSHVTTDLTKKNT